MQAQLLDTCPRAIRERKHIYVASGHSLGKDYICGAIGLWFLHSYQPSIVIQTAPTDRQVKKIMWGETQSHWNGRKLNLPGKAYRNPYLEIKKENWYLIGFTTKETGASKQAEGGKFQGFHSPNICVIVSEAQAVEDSIFDQIEAVTTSENILVIFIGNPTRASGRFAKGLRDRKSNFVFNFSCLENPNYKHKKTVIPGLASYEWVEDKRVKWGEDDPRWEGRVLGQVPTKSINNVFDQKTIDFIKERKRSNEAGKNNGCAIDVAGEGDDENIIYGGSCGAISETRAKTVQSPSENAIKVQQVLKAIDGWFAVVDCDGIGQGTYRELDDLGLEGIDIVKYHGSGACTKKTIGIKDYEFANLRAEAWLTALDRAKRGCALPPRLENGEVDPEWEEDILEVKFFENRKGKIQIEDKIDIKERLGRSPDKGDAWVMLQWGFEQKYRDRRQKEPEPGTDRQGSGMPVNDHDEIESENFSGY